MCEKQVTKLTEHQNNKDHTNRVTLKNERQALWDVFWRTFCDASVTTKPPVRTRSTRKRILERANILEVGSSGVNNSRTGTVVCTERGGNACRYVSHMYYCGLLKYDIFIDFAIKIENVFSCRTTLFTYTRSCAWHNLPFYTGKCQIELRIYASGKTAQLREFRTARLNFIQNKNAFTLTDMTDELEEEFTASFPIDIGRPTPLILQHYTPIVQHFCRADCHPGNLRFSVNQSFPNVVEMNRGESDLATAIGSCEFWRGGQCPIAIRCRQ